MHESSTHSHDAPSTLRTTSSYPGPHAPPAFWYMDSALSLGAAAWPSALLLTWEAGVSMGRGSSVHAARIDRSGVQWGWFVLFRGRLRSREGLSNARTEPPQSPSCSGRCRPRRTCPPSRRLRRVPRWRSRGARTRRSRRAARRSPSWPSSSRPGHHRRTREPRRRGARRGRGRGSRRRDARGARWRRRRTSSLCRLVDRARVSASTGKASRGKVLSGGGDVPNLRAFLCVGRARG